MAAKIKGSRSYLDAAERRLRATEMIPLLLKLYQRGGATLLCRNHSGIDEFFAGTQVFGVMTDDETQKAGTFEAEFRRQMRSGQVRRFVNALPTFAVDRETPDRFTRLLRELDDMAGGGQDNLPANPVRIRHN